MRIYWLLIVMSMGIITTGCQWGEQKLAEPPVREAPAVRQTLRTVDVSLPARGQAWVVEVADTPRAQVRGLMGRAEMRDEAGMLFVWGEGGRRSFWMKNTLIPLDIVFLDTDKRVVEVVTMEPCVADPCASRGPKTANVQYVLEVNGGTFAGEVGDVLEFSLGSE